MQRHLAELMDGNEIDDESGLPHMGHLQCNAMFYNYFTNKLNNIDEGKEISDGGEQY